MFSAALAQYFVAEPLGGLLVEDTLFLEHAEGISIQYLCPFIAIVAGSISSRHDMRELHSHTSICSGLLPGDLRLCPCFLLEGDDIFSERLLLGIVRHVEQSEAHLSETGGSCHEVPALDNPLDQVVGNGLAGLIMEGECSEELLFHRIVLHELRGQFHEVPPHIRAAQTLEA